MATHEHLANVLGAVALEVVTEMSSAMQRATGLSVVEVTALSALDNLGDGTLSIESLRLEVDLSQSASVRLVDRLVGRGLIRRVGLADDRRVTALQLSAAGRRAVATLRAARMSVLAERVSALSADQRQALGAGLEQLAVRGLAPAPEGNATANYRCRWCDTAACGHPDECPITIAVHG